MHNVLVSPLPQTPTPLITATIFFLLPYILQAHIEKAIGDEQRIDLEDAGSFSGIEYDASSPRV